MIKYSIKTSRDFLSDEWSKRLSFAGMDMTDAQYFIGSLHNELYIVHESEPEYLRLFNKVPTYTMVDLIHKLHKSSPLGKDIKTYMKERFKGKSMEEHIFNSANPITEAASILLDAVHLANVG